MERAEAQCRLQSVMELTDIRILKPSSRDIGHGTRRAHLALAYIHLGTLHRAGAICQALVDPVITEDF